MIFMDARFQESIHSVFSYKDWFSRVGKLDYDLKHYSHCSSWKDTCDLTISPDWKSAKNRSIQWMRKVIMEYDIDRYQEWDDLVEETKSVSHDFVENDLLPLIPMDYVEKISPILKFDFLNILMEAHYADILEPYECKNDEEEFSYLFFQRVFDVYLSGHFPCYWEGIFEKDKGRLVVF